MVNILDIGKTNFQCDICGDGMGWIHSVGKSQECECNHKRQAYYKAKEIVQNCNIPKLYHDASFDNYEQGNENPQILEICKRYAATKDVKNIGLLFMGGIGTGKTFLAVSIMKQKITYRIPSLFMPIYTLLSDLRTCEREQQRKMINRLNNIDFLVFDEIGSDKNTDWVVSQLHAIIDTRCNNMLPTIFTSNLSSKQLEEYLGKRLYSRILAANKVLYLEGDDYRKQQLETNFMFLKV